MWKEPQLELKMAATVTKGKSDPPKTVGMFVFSPGLFICTEPTNVMATWTSYPGRPT